MKRLDLIRHLASHGCEFLREGGSHTVYVNRSAQRSTAIPRHREINERYAVIYKCQPRMYKIAE